MSTHVSFLKRGDLSYIRLPRSALLFTEQNSIFSEWEETRLSVSLALGPPSTASYGVAGLPSSGSVLNTYLLVLFISFSVSLTHIP